MRKRSRSGITYSRLDLDLGEYWNCMQFQQYLTPHGLSCISSSVQCWRCKAIKVFHQLSSVGWRKSSPVWPGSTEKERARASSNICSSMGLKGMAIAYLTIGQHKFHKLAQSVTNVPKNTSATACDLGRLRAWMSAKKQRLNPERDSPEYRYPVNPC